jgi:hypothetical protein
MNVGTNILRKVYVGFFADCDVGPKAVPQYYSRNYSEYIPDVRTAYTHNPVDKPTTPVGITVLGTPKSLEDTTMKYTFQWYPGPQSPTPDRVRYDFMSRGEIKPSEYPQVSDTRQFFSFGPFDTLKPGDTLKIVVAIVSGDGVTEGPNNLHDNAARALELYQRGWTAPPVPPSPPLKVIHIEGTNRVELKWKWHPEDSLRFPCNPLNVWDDSNKYIESTLPPSDWRRKNPGLRCDRFNTGGSSGGRTFQGFRVWRSVAPEFDSKAFALLGQYDIYDSLKLGEGGMLQDRLVDSTISADAEGGYTFIDSNLVIGRRYTYSVTSYTIPGVTVTLSPNESGGLDTIKTYSAELESSLDENDTTIILPFRPSDRLGEVKVVPNPYRTDADYTFESGGWEGLGRTWHEGKRVIWFIHLPSDCTIRIFSLTGDLIATLYHNDVLRVEATKEDPGNPKPKGQEEWNLISESGRAIASGIYIFTVESDYGRQIGKFVVIR